MSTPDIVSDAYINSSGHLILVMSSGREIDSGSVTRPTPTVTDSYIEANNKLIVVFDDTEKVEVMDVADLGYRDVKEVYLNGYDVMVKYLDDTIELIGNVFVDTNSEIYATYINRDDGFIYGIRYNGEIETIGSMEKYIGDRLSENIIQITSNELEEVIITTDANEYNIGKIYYKNYNAPEEDENKKNISNIYIDSTTNLLNVLYDDGTKDEAGRAKYVNINGHPLVLANAHINEIGHLNLEIMKVDEFGDFVMKSVPQYNDDGNVTYEDEFDTELIDVGKVKGQDGVDGTKFQNVEIDSTGMLSFVTSEGAVYSAGYLPDRSVANAYIDIDGILTLVLSNDEEIKTSNVLGKDGTDGETISRAYVDDDGMLWFGFEDSVQFPDIPAGIVKNPVEISVTRDEHYNLIFNMSDGVDYNVGQIPGVQSKYITRLENVEGVVYGAFSDDPENMVRLGDLSYTPTSLSSSTDGKLTLTFSDGTEVVSTDRVYGKDGDGIVKIDFEGNDLAIYHTENNRATTTKTVFEDVKGREISDILYLDDTHQFDFRYNDGTNIKIDLPALTDGVGIADISMINGTLVISTSDGQNYTFDNVQGEGVALIGSTDDSLIFKNTVSDDIYTLNAVQGIDGDGITDVTLDNETITFKFKQRADVIFDLPVGTNQDIVVTDIVFNEVDNTLVISSDRDADIIVPIPLPEDGDRIDAAFVDENDDLVFHISSLEEPLIFPVIKGVDANSITNVSYNRTTEQLEILLSKSEPVYVDIPRPADGVSVLNIKQVGKSLVFQMSDSTTHSIEIPFGKDGIGIDKVTYDDVNEEIVFDLSNNTSSSFPVIKGTDGRSITDIQYDGSNVSIYIDSVLDTTIPFRTGIDGTSVTDVYFDALDLIIETDIPETDGTLKTLRYPLIKGQDAVDGISIQDIYLDASFNLNFIMNDAAITTYRIPNMGIKIVDIELMSNGGLKFTYNNGDVKSTSNVVGRDGNGRGVSDITLVGNTITIKTSDSAGDIITHTSEINTAGIDGTSINAKGELVFSLSDGSTKNVGRVEGINGKWLKEAYITTNDALVVTVTDGETDTTTPLGNVRGVDGRHLTDFDIDHKTGDFTVHYSDNTSQMIGNIKEKLSLSTWTIDEAPYAYNRVVLHKGSMFIAQTSTSQEPPASQWREVAFNDQFIEVLPPYAITPNNEGVSTLTPTLIGSEFNGFHSIRDYREFEVRHGGMVISTIMDDSDYTDIPSTVTLSRDVTTYNWRMRDVSVNGYVSAWSDYYPFFIEEVILAPVITLFGDKDNVTPSPRFAVGELKTNLDIYDVTDKPAHTSTLWEIATVLDDTIVYSHLVENGVKEIIIPHGTLTADTQYYIRAKIYSATNASTWSDKFSFSTELTHDNYLRTPVVIYTEGDPFAVNPDNPKFKSNRLARTDKLTNAYNRNESVKHVSSDWEIYDGVDGTVIKTMYESSSIMEVCAFFNYVLNREYRIRVRYNTDRFGSTEWSDWLVFKITTSIETPYITTLENTNAFPNKGLLQFSPFAGVNAIHESTEIRITDYYSGEEILLFSDTPTTKQDFVFKIPYGMENKEIDFSIRYISQNYTSEWSAPMHLALGSNYNLTVFSNWSSSVLNIIDDDSFKLYETLNLSKYYHYYYKFKQFPDSNNILIYNNTNYDGRIALSIYSPDTRTIVSSTLYGYMSLPMCNSNDKFVITSNNIFVYSYEGYIHKFTIDNEVILYQGSSPNTSFEYGTIIFIDYLGHYYTMDAIDAGDGSTIRRIYKYNSTLQLSYFIDIDVTGHNHILNATDKGVYIVTPENGTTGIIAIKLLEGVIFKTFDINTGVSSPSKLFGITDLFDDVSAPFSISQNRTTNMICDSSGVLVFNRIYGTYQVNGVYTTTGAVFSLIRLSNTLEIVNKSSSIDAYINEYTGNMNSKNIYSLVDELMDDQYSFLDSNGNLQLYDARLTSGYHAELDILTLDQTTLDIHEEKHYIKSEYGGKYIFVRKNE